METNDKSHLKTLGVSHRARNNTVVLNPEEVNSVRHEASESKSKTLETTVSDTQSTEAADGFKDVSATTDVFEGLLQDDAEDSPVLEGTLAVDSEDVFGDLDEHSESFPVESEGDIEVPSASELEHHELESGSSPTILESIDVLDSSGEIFDSHMIDAEVEQGESLNETLPEVVSAPPPSEAAVDNLPKEVPGEISSYAIETMVWRRKGAISGFLVSFDDDANGSFLELREGRLLVTSEIAGFENCLVINHHSVSPLHAILRISQGSSIDVLDQLSEHGTRIISHETGSELLLSGERGHLEHGDIVVFGERKFHVCLLAVEKT